MSTQRERNRDRMERNQPPAPGLGTRIVGAATLVAVLALGATGAMAVLVTAAVVALVGFAGSRLAMKRFHCEGESSLDADFRRYTGQLP